MTTPHSKKRINFSLQDQDENQTTNPIDKIVKNIKTYSEQNGNLLEKYNQQFYLNYFDRNTIQQVLIKLGGQQEQKKELVLEEFIRRFLSYIDHKEEETLFLAMSLRKLFLKIREETNNQIGLKFSDFTTYLCDRIAKENPDLIVPLKQVPQEKILPDVTRVREIDINPPLVLKNDAESDLPKISKTKKKKDKKLVERKPVSKFVYDSVADQIITIGRLSSCIHFYDTELKKLSTQIQPKTYLDIARQIAILSMDFDECNQRIGAIINGMGIIFWQASDNFETQKAITKYYGLKIIFLKLFKEWVTADKNTVYFWNLKDECVGNKIVYDEAMMVNDVCEINHLRCVCVSYTTIDEKKPFILYKNSKPIARYEMGSPGCHSLHYNIPSQMIVTAGFHNQMEVFEVEDKTFSINLKKQLKGHSSIVTCISDIKNTNFILSGDDSGEIRIWELNFMRCIQAVRVSNCISQVYCTGEKLIFSDSRLNVMEMDKFSLPYTNDDEIIYHFFEEQTSAQFTVTRKCIRKIDFQTGRIEMIFVVCDEEEDISSAINISAGVVIGTSKGHLKLYTTQGKEKWNVLAHEGQVCTIKYDRKTRFIFSLGSDGKMMIWPEKTLLVDGAKKVLSFKNKGFNILTLFTEVRIMFLASSQEPQISVWDYENLKLLTVIKLPSPVICMQVNALYRMLLVSTGNDELCIFKLHWKNGYLEFQTVYQGDSMFSGLRKSKTVNYLMPACPQKNGSVKIFDESSATKSKKNITKEKVSKKQITLDQSPSSTHITTSKKFENNKEEKKPQKNQLKRAESNVLVQQKSEPLSVPIPSIKLIKQESPVSVAQQTEKALASLKTVKKIQGQITTRIEIKSIDDSIFMVLGNSKGQLTCFDITQLIKEHFADCETQLNRIQSPNIYRPIKQDYEQQLAKQKYTCLSLQTITKIANIKKSYFKFSWKQACNNREPISCLDFIQMKQIYLCASMTDGSCKYFDFASGTIKGDLKINLPLPIKWDIEIEKDLYIKKNVYETLIVLDNVISNYGFEMLSKQYKAINVTTFLQMLKKKRITKTSTKLSLAKQTQHKKKITLLNEEYSLEDVKNITHGIKETKESTLKSLEAQKRVKLIKQQMSLDQMESEERNAVKDDGIKKLSNQILRQKEELVKLLAPNYFAVVAEFGATGNLSKSVELGSIEQRSSLLLEKIKRNKTNLQSQQAIHKPSSKKIKRQASMLPALPSISSQIVESAQLKQEPGKEGTLVDKITNSFDLRSLSLKPKVISECSTSTQTNLLMSSILKKNFPLISANSSKISQISHCKSAKVSAEKENKYGKGAELNRSSLIEDKTARQILTQINEKLQMYKKFKNAKREIF